MSPLAELMTKVVELAQENCPEIGTISASDVTTGNGIYVDHGVGVAGSLYYDKSAIRDIPIIFFCKNTEKAKCVEQLASICDYFSQLKEYPDGESFQWLNTTIAGYPSKVEQEETGAYKYTCTMICKIFY